jgi:hypothetical protein
MRALRLGRIAAVLLATGAAVLSQSAGSFFDLNHEAIRYAKAPVNDAITRLEADIASRRVRLRYDSTHGYLPALLQALRVPVESQMLVFSKTSFQAARINPVTPRAIYFNDQVSVGYVSGGDVLEVAAHDPKQGVIFYTLDQDSVQAPAFVRRDDACLQCHQNPATADVPGLMIRSVYPEPSGMPFFQAGGFISDHRSPLDQRWGGWFVTGRHGSQKHMGNAFARNRQNPGELDMSASLNRTELPPMVRREALLSEQSDIVALLVAEHQFHGMNLITRLGFETRMAVHQRDLMARLLGEPSAESAASARRRIARQGDELVRYLLFADEAKLTAPIEGSTRFAEVFAGGGPADSRSRSLRQFDLRNRLFRYPLSYLVYTDAFRNLPSEAMHYVSERLAAALMGTGEAPRVSPEDRAAIVSILRDTQRQLPDPFVAALQLDR